MNRMPCPSEMPRLSPNGIGPDDDYDDRYTEDDAHADATDEIERDGYSLGWTLQEICIVDPKPVPCSVWIDDEFYAPDHSSQDLLAIIFNATGQVRDAAIAELKSRVTQHHSFTDAIEERTRELMKEAA